MDESTFASVYDYVIHKVESVLGKKSEEYSYDNDRLANFRVAAVLQDISMRKALAGMMAKHTTSVYQLCAEEELASISMWDEKIVDHINYLILLRAIVNEEARSTTLADE